MSEKSREEAVKAYFDNIKKQVQKERKEKQTSLSGEAFTREEKEAIQQRVSFIIDKAFSRN